MKKRKFITVLSAAMLTAVALGSCSVVKSKDGVVLVYDGKEYTANELYEGEKTPAAAEAKFKAVYKVAVRRYFEEGQPGHDYMDQITIDTKNKISGQKATAQSNADKNGTSYDTEWDKILTSNNVEDEQELYDKFEYELQKEKFDDKFYENNYDVLRKGGNFVDEKGTAGKVGLEKGYLETKQPYHMKHILVKLANAKEGNNTSVEISKEEAIKLYNVAHELALGKSFEYVSNLYNDDETAKGAHSSLGIMSRDTSFVNDFKLGTYMYEAFYGSSTKNTSQTYKGKTAKTALGLDDTSPETAGHYAELILELQDRTTGAGQIGQIPYEAFEALGKDNYIDPASGSGEKQGLAEIDLNDKEIKDRFINQAGLQESDVKSKFLPRNVIFNKYLNKHNISVITPTALAANETARTYISTDGKSRTSTSENFTVTSSTRYENKDLFPGLNRETEKNNDKVEINSNNKVLRDENGRVVLVFRSGTSGDSGYQGIHFVVIERSPFIDKETDEGHTDTTSLEEYYTQYYPDQAGGDHPRYNDGDKGYKHTYVNYVMGETEVKQLKSRADSVKSELKKTSSHLDKYIFDYLVDKGELKFANTDQGNEIKETINNWKKITIEASEKDDKKSWNNTWRSYYNSLEVAVEQRAEYGEASESKRSYLITEACIDAFLNSSKEVSTDWLKNMFSAGGVFHE